MNKLFLVLFLCLLVGSSLAQTRKIVLLEEATNASCTPCAQNNPKLQAFFSKNFGGVVSVRYHAWWPGTDPMYSLNTTDNSARINYYGISGVPNYLIDGVNYGVPGDPSAMQSQMMQQLANPSPVSISVVSNIASDSVRATVTLKVLAPVSQGQLYLRTAVIERLVVYSSPPGTNGEKQFPDVMRKLLPDANGISVGTLNVGDSLVHHFAVPVNAAWNWQDLAVVSWLQSDAGKEVIQAGIDLPTYLVESSGAATEVLGFNQPVTRQYFIANTNTVPLNLRVLPDLIHVPAAWGFQMLYNGIPQDSFDVTLQPGDSVHFELSFQTGAESDYLKVGLFAKNLDDPYGYGMTAGYFGIIFNGNVLFVDDDGGETYETNFYTAFDSAGVDYTSIAQGDLLPLASYITPVQFKAIFWNVSWGFPAFVPGDIAFLKTYLNNGGNLFVCGQDIGWDIFDASGSSNFPEAKDFYHTYLDANYVNDNSGVFQLQGVSGDPITDGISTNINNVYSRYPEWIDSYSGGSVKILQYATSGKYGALRYDSGTYKTVYIGVGLEQMSDVNARLQIVENTLGWFNVPVGIKSGEPQMVGKFELEQNYPNPFNPDTHIRFMLPQSDRVELSVFNLLGQKVAGLVSGTLAAGAHEVQWDGRNQAGNPVSSGVYIYRLKTSVGEVQRKMMLLR